MKTKICFSVTFIAVLFACSSKKTSEAELIKTREEVINNDLEFSGYSEQHGFSKALAEYAADDAIKLNTREYSTFGIAQLRKDAKGDTVGSSQGTLTWEPKKVHISESGDMAAAYGDWYFKFKSPRTAADTTLYGNYLTVWKKQNDGKWKFILDGGNSTPGPTTKEMLDLVK